MKSETLSRIEAALRRLDQGTYGNCVGCRGRISNERLRALPFAVRCTGCEKAREMSERRRQVPDPRWGYDPLSLLSE